MQTAGDLSAFTYATRAKNAATSPKLDSLIQKNRQAAVLLHQA
jgi:hypothetical protein